MLGHAARHLRPQTIGASTPPSALVSLHGMMALIAQVDQRGVGQHEPHQDQSAHGENGCYDRKPFPGRCRLLLGHYDPGLGVTAEIIPSLSHLQLPSEFRMKIDKKCKKRVRILIPGFVRSIRSRAEEIQQSCWRHQITRGLTVRVRRVR